MASDSPSHQSASPSRRRLVIAGGSLALVVVVAVALVLALRGSAQPSAASTATVPQLAGQSYRHADAVLAAHGFQVHNVAVDSSKPAGSVVSTSPAANSSIAAGSTITVRYSNGGSSATAQVPNVIGKSLGAAKAALAAAHVPAPKVKYVSSSAADAGKVISQSPAPGKVPSATVVTIVVGRGASSTTTTTTSTTPGTTNGSSSTTMPPNTGGPTTTQPTTTQPTTTQPTTTTQPKSTTTTTTQPKSTTTTTTIPGY